jgi:hypothetical protein
MTTAQSVPSALQPVRIGPLSLHADRDATRAEYARWEPADAVLGALADHPEIMPGLPPELLAFLDEIGIDPFKPSCVRAPDAGPVHVEWVFFGPPWWPEDDFPAFSADLSHELRMWVYADGVAARPGFALRQRWTIAAELRTGALP